MRQNLRLVYGEQLTDAQIKSAVRAASEQLIVMGLELLWLQRDPEERLRERVDVEGAENLRQALEEGHGAILFSGHMSNWMAVAARIAGEGFPVTNIMRRREHKSSDEFIWSALRRIGYECVGREEGIWPLVRLLKRNEVLGFIGDNAADPEQGLRVELLGHSCYMWSTPVTLSLMTEAPVLPVATIMGEDGRYYARIFPAMRFARDGSRTEATKREYPRLMEWLETQIRAAPDQWAWYYERWEDA
jgi:Kdo2-lipid IVA lauroyltransferase/acyltransferase